MNTLFDLPSPSVVMITSSFCSKCHYNRNLWTDVTGGELDLIEFNIAEEMNQPILDQLHPLVAPTTYIINQNTVEFTFEGVMTSNIVKSIIKILRKLNNENINE